MARRLPDPEVEVEIDVRASQSLAWVAFSPQGSVSRWPKSRLRRWWRRRRGWTFYDGDGRRV